jgi:hypothetical protein
VQEVWGLRFEASNPKTYQKITCHVDRVRWWLISITILQSIQLLQFKPQPFSLLHGAGPLQKLFLRLIWSLDLSPKKVCYVRFFLRNPQRDVEKSLDRTLFTQRLFVTWRTWSGGATPKIWPKGSSSWWVKRVCLRSKGI